MNEIAIASVPIQPWEQPYELEKAFREGTIFPCLNKLFYVEEEITQPKAVPKSDCEAKLNSIQEVTFALIDITLYLDTHPEDKEAKQYHDTLRQKRKDLMQEFASANYPLTLDCEGCWSDGPIPWEGVC